MLWLHYSEKTPQDLTLTVLIAYLQTGLNKSNTRQRTLNPGLSGWCLPVLVHVRVRLCFAIKPPWSSVNCSHKQAPARCEPLPTEDCERLAVSGIHNQTCPRLSAAFCLEQIRQTGKPNTADLLLKLKLYRPQLKYLTWKSRHKGGVMP